MKHPILQFFDDALTIRNQLIAGEINFAQAHHRLQEAMMVYMEAYTAPTFNEQAKEPQYPLRDDELGGQFEVATDMNHIDEEITDQPGETKHYESDVERYTDESP